MFRLKKQKNKQTKAQLATTVMIQIPCQRKECKRTQKQSKPKVTINKKQLSLESSSYNMGKVNKKQNCFGQAIGNLVWRTTSHMEPHILYFQRWPTKVYANMSDVQSNETTFFCCWSTHALHLAKKVLSVSCAAHFIMKSAKLRMASYWRSFSCFGHAVIV